jgi:hypothetical protein
VVVVTHSDHRSTSLAGSGAIMEATTSAPSADMVREATIPGAEGRPSRRQDLLVIMIQY